MEDDPDWKELEEGADDDLDADDEEQETSSSTFRNDIQ